MKIYHLFLEYFTTEAQTKNKRVVTSVAKGPLGRVDTHQLYFSEDENPWYVASSLKAQRAKYIIFSDPLLECRQPCTFEQELWNEWTSNHAVYPWQEEILITSNLECPQALHMPHATEEEIKLSLQKKGLNPNEFIILDSYNYYAFLRSAILNRAKARGFVKNSMIGLPIEELTVLYIANSLLDMGSTYNKSFFISDELEQKLNQVKKQAQTIQQKPLSTDTISLQLESENDFQAAIEKLKNNTNLKHLHLKLNFALINGDLSQLNLQSLFIASNSKVKITAIPPTLSTIEIESVELVIPKLHEHKTLKKVRITGKFHYTSYLPNSVESLELINQRELYLENRIEHFKSLKHLGLLDIKGLNEIKYLPKTLNSLIIINCPELEVLDLKDIRQLEQLELMYLGQNLRIYCSDQLDSISHLNVVGIQSTNSYTENDKAIESLSGTDSPLLKLLLSIKNYKKIEDLIAQIRFSTQMNICNVNSSQLDLRGKTGKITVRNCRELIQLNLDPENQNIEVTNCPKIPPQSTSQPDLSSEQPLKLSGPLSPNISHQKHTEIEIVDNMMMGEDFYPANITKLRVTNGRAWKFKLDCNSFFQLEELVLDNVDDLVVLDNLPKTLKRLEISNCKHLQAINFNHLEHLDRLKLINLNKDTVILNSDQLKSLDYYYLDSICDFHYKLAMLIETLDSCEVLTVRNNNMGILQSLPKKCKSITFEHCPSIGYLNVSKVEGLEKLRVEHCHQLHGISKPPHTLTHLYIRFNYELAPPTLKGLSNLKECFIYLNRLPMTERTLNFAKITEELIKQRLVTEENRLNKEGIAQGYINLRDLSTLTQGSLSDKKELRLCSQYLEGKMIVPDLSKIQQLEHLTLKNIYLSNSENLPKNLKTLCIKPGSEIVDLSHLSLDTQIILEESNDAFEAGNLPEDIGTIVLNCQKNKIVLNLKNVVSIQKLIVQGDLKNLSIEYSDKPTYIDYFECDLENDTPGSGEQTVDMSIFVRSCRHIKIESSKHIKYLCFSKIQKLKKLEIFGCPQLRSITSGLSSTDYLPASLEELDLRNNPSLFHPTLIGLTHLKAMRFLTSSSEQQSASAILPTDTNIEILKLDSTKNGGDCVIPNLSRYKKLKALDLQYMALGDLENLPLELECIRINQCMAQFPFINFEKLKKLETISISNTSGLTTISKFNSRIKEIELRGNDNLVTVNLKGVTFIEEFGLFQSNLNLLVVEYDDALQIETLQSRWDPSLSKQNIEIFNSDSVKSLLLRLNNATLDSLPTKTKAKTVKLIAHVNEQIQGSLSLAGFITLRSLIVSDCHLITEIKDFPQSLEEIAFTDNYCLKIDLSDPDYSRMKRITIQGCGRIDYEDPIFQESLKPYGADNNTRSTYIADSVRYGRPFVKKVTNINSEYEYRAIKNAERLEKLKKELEKQYGNEYLIDTSDRLPSKTAFMRIMPESTPDNSTGVPIKFLNHLNKQSPSTQSAQRGFDQCLVMVYDVQGKVTKDDFRFNTYNAIHFDASSRTLTLQYKPRHSQKINIRELATPFTNTTLDKLKRFSQENASWAMCYSDFTLKKGQSFTLVTTPVTNPADQMKIFCNETESLDLIFDKEAQITSFSLKPNVPELSIKMAHQFWIQQDYLFKDSSEFADICISETPLLSEELRAEIEKVLKSKPHLSVLLDSNNLSVPDKLCHLFTLCLDFEQESSEKELMIHTIDAIFDNLINKRGVCRHRADIFMLITQYLNVPTTAFSNEEHKFVEIPLQINGRIVRKGLYIGGGVSISLVSKKAIEEALTSEVNKTQEKKPEIPLELKQEAEQTLDKEEDKEKLIVQKPEEAKNPRENAREELIIAKQNAEIAKAKLIDAQQKKSKTEASLEKVRHLFTNIEKEIKSQQEAHQLSAKQLLAEKAKEDQARNELTIAEQNAEKVKTKLVDAQDELSKMEASFENVRLLFPETEILDSILPLFNSDAPHAPLLHLPDNADPVSVYACIRAELMKSDDLKLTKKFVYINDPKDMRRYLKSIRISNGTREFVPGPLVNLLAKGGIIVINWTPFSDTQKASYMSMLEPQGNLSGHTVTDSVKIISLIQDSAIIGCKAFLSRTSPYYLSSNYTNNTPQYPANDSAEFLEINLFHLPNWRERLFRRVERKDQGYFSIDGAIPQALSSGKNLSLVNLPDDSDLPTFLSRLEIEREFFDNGEFVQIPPSFCVKTYTRPLTLEAENVTLSTKLSAEKKPGYFLNANNLTECFSQIVVNNKLNSITPSPGLFQNNTEFYITEMITTYEWSELVEKAKEYPKHFTFTLLPGAEIQGYAISNQEDQVQEETAVHYSHDPDAKAIELKESLHPEAIIVDVCPQITYQQLLATIDDQRTQDGKVCFQYQPQVVLGGLICGATIILNGQLSSALYQQLVPFLYPRLSLIFQNGKEVEPEGRLICVMPTENQDSSTVSEEETPSIEDKEIQEKVTLLFKLASQLSHKEIGQPPLPVLTQRRLSAISTRLKDKSLSAVHKQNPIKGLFNLDYPKDSDNYAFLNVVAKYLFGPDNDEETPYRHNQSKELSEWQLMNHCCASVIRKFLGDSLDKAITFNNGRALLNDPTIISSLQSQLPAIQDQPTYAHKPNEYFQKLFNAKHTKVIFLKGSHGTGKSYGLRELKKSLPEGHYYKGRAQFINWLTAEPVNDEDPIIFHDDEINMRDPGTLDIYKGIFREVMHYEGKYYKITPQHGIVGTGNSETYPNRHFHRFLMEYAETVFYPLPKDTWVQNHIILPGLDTLDLPQEDKELVARELLDFSHQFTDFIPHTQLSLRDINSLVKRFAIIYTDLKDIEASITKSLWHEYGMTIGNPDQREKFKNLINMKEVHPEDIEVTEINRMSIPSTKQSLIDIILEDIKICHASAEQSHRRGILIEGPSGIGKSSLYKALLEKDGYTKNNPDSQKRYYEISVDEGDAAIRMCLEAYFNGSTIILDELNLNPRLEDLLNELMEGCLPDDQYYSEMIRDIAGENPVAKPNFFVLASQNPGQTVSLALLNRFHNIQAEDYTQAELAAILKNAAVPEPEDMLDQFNQAHQENPNLYNTRKLFELMRKTEFLQKRIQMKEEFNLAQSKQKEAKEHLEFLSQKCISQKKELRKATELRTQAEQKTQAEAANLTKLQQELETLKQNLETLKQEIENIKTVIEDCLEQEKIALSKLETLKIRFLYRPPVVEQVQKNELNSIFEPSNHEVFDQAKKTKNIKNEKSLLLIAQNAFNEEEASSNSGNYTDVTDSLEETESSHDAKVEKLNVLKNEFSQNMKWTAYKKSKPSPENFNSLTKLNELNINALNIQSIGSEKVQQAMLNLLAYTAKLASEPPSFFKRQKSYRDDKINELVNFLNKFSSNPEDFSEKINDALLNEKLTLNRTTGFFRAYGHKVHKRNTAGEKSKHHWVRSTTEELLHELQKAHQDFLPDEAENSISKNTDITSNNL